MLRLQSNWFVVWSAGGLQQNAFFLLVQVGQLGKDKHW
jgi:hypothetical protein